MSETPDSKSLSQERYSQFAAGYVSSETHAKGADLERLVAIAKPRQDWVVLDVATGGGHTALKFSPYVRSVFATDLTLKMLDKAKAFITGQAAMNVRFSAADAENLPFAQRCFDLVTCRIAPHHFPDTARFVREAARVLKPGGVLLVQDHVLPTDLEAAQYVDGFEKLRDPSHNQAFTESAWREMFSAAGFSIEHTEQLTKRHQFLSWAKRQGCTPAVIDQLVDLLRHAPQDAAHWMQAEHSDNPGQASFVNHHLIIAGRCPESRD